MHFRVHGYRVLGFRVLGFRVLGFLGLGFGVLGFRVLGFRAQGLSPTSQGGNEVSCIYTLFIIYSHLPYSEAVRLGCVAL